MFRPLKATVHLSPEKYAPYQAMIGETLSGVH
jgi:hypothetical protein